MAKKTPDQKLAQQFDRALAFAADARARLDELSVEPIRYAALRDLALAPFDAACVRLHTEFNGRGKAGRAKAAEAAWLRASHVLEPLIEERENGLRLLTDRNVLVEPDGGLFLEEEPLPVDERAPRKAPPTCCITWIKLKNITANRLRLTLTHENGSRKRRVFQPGETRTASWREGADDTLDDDGNANPRLGPMIPGGMGHCVTITVEAPDGPNWREVVKQTICCDDRPPPGPGTMIEDVRSVGGSPEHFARYRAFEIVDIKIEKPCPNLAPAAPVQGPRGTADSQSSRFNGIQTAPGKHLYAAGCWLRFVPTNCQSFCFVQGVIRRVFIQPPNGVERPAPLLGTPGDDFKLDIRKQDRTPCYPHVTDIEGGGKVLRDYPGVSNPWSPVRIDGKNAGNLAKDTKLRIEWTFRTWVVCLDGPPRVLGYFDWSMKVVVTIGTGPGDTTAEITPPTPEWKNGPDKSGYNKVAGQAPEPGGFIAP